MEVKKIRPLKIERDFMKRLNRKTAVVFIFLIMGVFVLYYLSQRPFKDYQEIKTSSGLKILFLKDKSLPFIQFKALFPKAGADYDGEGQSGLASLTAFLIEQGAGGLSSAELHEELNQLGTGLDIRVGRQTAVLALSGLSWHGPKLWDLFKKALAEPHFSPEEMKILRRQFIERRFKSLDNPSFVADDVWRQRLFKNSMGKDENGNLISLSKISVEDVRNFYKKHYLEGEPILMVAGQYDKKLKKDIVSFFNQKFSHQNQKFEVLSSPDLKSEFKLVANDSLSQAEIRLGYSLGPFPVEDPKRFLALKAVNFILGGGGMHNRLWELREKRGLTYGSYSYISFGKLYGLFSLDGSTKTNTVREFLEQTLIILKKFKKEGASLQELSRAKQTLKSRHLKKIETPENRLNQFIHFTYYIGTPAHFLENYLNILNDISLEELNRLIKEFILSKPLQILIYGHSSLESQLKGLEGFPPLKTVPFEDYFKEELRTR